MIAFEWVLGVVIGFVLAVVALGCVIVLGLAVMDRIKGGDR